MTNGQGLVNLRDMTSTNLVPVTIHITAGEHDIVAEAALLDGTTLESYVRESAVSSARIDKVIVISGLVSVGEVNSSKA